MHTVRNVAVYLNGSLFVFTENFTTNDVKFLVGIARVNVPTVLPLVLLTKVNTAVMLVVKRTRVLHTFFQVCLKVL